MSEPTANIRGGTRTNLSAPVPALAPDGGRNDDLKQTPGDGGSGAARYGCAAELRDRAAAEAETAETVPARRDSRTLSTREGAAGRTSSKNVPTDTGPERIRYERSLMPKTSSASAGGRPQRSASSEEGSEDGRHRAARPTSQQSGGSWQRRRRWKPAESRKRRTRLGDAAMIRPYSSSHDPWLPSQAGDTARGRNFSDDEDAVAPEQRGYIRGTEGGCADDEALSRWRGAVQTNKRVNPRNNLNNN